MHSRGAINGDLINVLLIGEGVFSRDDTEGEVAVVVGAAGAASMRHGPTATARAAFSGTSDIVRLVDALGTARIGVPARFHTARQVAIEGMAALRVTTALGLVFAWLRPSRSRIVVPREIRSVLVPPEDRNTP